MGTPTQSATGVVENSTKAVPPQSLVTPGLALEHLEKILKLFSIEGSPTLEKGAPLLFRLTNEDFALVASALGKSALIGCGRITLDDNTVIERDTQKDSADTQSIKHDWQTSYRDLRVKSPSEAMAPLNPEYLKWRMEHPDPKLEFGRLFPSDTPTAQRTQYLTYFKKPERDKARTSHALSFVRRGSPLLIPSNAKLEIAPYIRDRNEPPYLQTIVSWTGEHLGDKGRASNHILYRARFHTNTRAVSGEPPSLVVSREYQGVTERLLWPGANVRAALQHTLFKASVQSDLTGNIWLSESACNLASEKRREIPEAKVILYAEHHSFWRRDLHGASL